MASTVSQLDGVAQLQVAKAAATAKIEEARTRRINRLKQAKDEAKIEANLYKAEREAALKELEQRYAKHDADSGGKIENFTSLAVEKLRSKYEDNKEVAISSLLSQVLVVNPTTHRNINSAY